MKHELLTDMYEFSMANGYYQTLPHDKQARFDVFYRKAPDDGSFVISAGLMQVIDEVKNWHFSTDDIAYLRSLNHFSETFSFTWRQLTTAAQLRQSQKARQSSHRNQSLVLVAH